MGPPVSVQIALPQVFDAITIELGNLCRYSAALIARREDALQVPWCTHAFWTSVTDR
jgi:hypothetical protein